MQVICKKLTLSSKKVKTRIPQQRCIPAKYMHTFTQVFTVCYTYDSCNNSYERFFNS